MAQVQKIDSNVTGLRFAEEQSIGVLPATPVWYPLEPNSYNDFGGQIKTVARNPINQGRQRQKGTTVDLDASGGFNTDLTQTNLQRLLQGFFFADARRKGEADVVSVDGTAEGYHTLTTTGFYAGSLIFADGHDNVENDGLKTVASVTPRVADFGTLTIAMAQNAVDGETVTIGSTVYTWESGTLDAAFKVKVGADRIASLTSLSKAINLTGVVGTDYGSGTTLHPTVTATDNLDGTMTATAKDTVNHVTGDAIATTETMTQGSWGATTLGGGNDGLIVVEEDIVDETTPSGAPTIVVVGFQFDAGDLDVDASGSLPKLTMTAKAVEELGLTPGEPIWIGGDGTGFHFLSALNGGWARVKSITQGSPDSLTLDKTGTTFVTEVSTMETVQIFFGRVLKNELGTLIKRRTYNLERTLGAPDDSNLSQVQSEYLTGSLANELALKATTADKITADLSFVSTNNEQRSGVTGVKSGTRPDIVSSDAFNTSNDVVRLRMTILDPANSNPTDLFAYLTEFTLNVKNNVSPNKAISVLGAFEVTAGQFVVDGSATAYFSSVEAVAAVRNNEDVTFDFAIAKNNAGIFFDIPLLSLGDARNNVEQDKPILLPLTMDAAEDRTYHHTALVSFFDYLPDAVLA